MQSAMRALSTEWISTREPEGRRERQGEFAAQMGAEFLEPGEDFEASAAIRVWTSPAHRPASRKPGGFR